MFNEEDIKMAMKFLAKAQKYSVLEEWQVCKTLFTNNEIGIIAELGDKYTLATLVDDGELEIEEIG